MRVNQVMNAELCRAGEVWLEKRIPEYILKKNSGSKDGISMEAQENPNCCTSDRTGRQAD